MTTIYKLCFALGLLATGGEVVNHGEEHVASLKKMAAPIWQDDRPDKGISVVAVTELNQLPTGVQRVQK